MHLFMCVSCKSKNPGLQFTGLKAFDCHVHHKLKCCIKVSDTDAMSFDEVGIKKNLILLVNSNIGNWLARLTFI